MKKFIFEKVRECLYYMDPLKSFLKKVEENEMKE